MIDVVRFASCYIYSPHGSGAASERSRLLRALLKSRDAHFILKYAVRVRQQMVDTPSLAGFISATSVLVPVPGSAPHINSNLSVASHLASALLNEGLGDRIWPGLLRVRAVRKSATAMPGSRPTVGNHYDSFAVDPIAALPQDVILVDDVVTKGRTLLAAAARVHEALPRARIRGFALLRTMGLLAGVDHVLEPCVGEIRWRAGDARRTP